MDLLVVLRDSDDVVGSRREARAIRAAVDGRTQVCLLTETSLREHFTGGTVFAAHLAREGKVAADPSGFLTELLREHPVDQPVKESAAGLLSQLEVYADLSWCGGHYLFCLADLYAWSRSGAMLALAQAGTFEFDRVRVFDALSGAYPELADPATVARRLRPFWELVNRGETAPLPFPAEDSDRETLAAREACRAILEKGM